MTANKHWLITEDCLRHYPDVLEAAATDTEFPQFRSLPWIRNVIETRSEIFSCMWDWAVHIFPELHHKREQLQAIDAIGEPPIRCDHAGTTLSPTFACYAFYAALLYWLFGDLNKRHFVEIGAGYGGLAAILATMFPDIEITIFDLPQAKALQRRFLSAANVECVQWRSLDETETGDSFDVAFSSCALSEFDEFLRDQYATSVLKASRQGVLVWNFADLPGRIRNAEEACRWLQTHIPQAASLVDIVGRRSTFEGANWYLAWGASPIMSMAHDDDKYRLAGIAKGHMKFGDDATPNDKISFRIYQQVQQQPHRTADCEMSRDGGNLKLSFPNGPSPINIAIDETGRLCIRRDNSDDMLL